MRYYKFHSLVDRGEKTDATLMLLLRHKRTVRYRGRIQSRFGPGYRFIALLEPAPKPKPAVWNVIMTSGGLTIGKPANFIFNGCNTWTSP